ncbi:MULTISPECIES: reverse transcriptase N-terminal domain-containing protein [unclassified Nostoc]|uniref:reverse transcriptase N-terminal domain-containing protein n=1 Tax=unclassified Nostoc TaxID=2593658 RepID=UPI002AD35220|nr:reverse transcriptase N-terminal domain-containing protein [Nostoc sp. DedQUE03]MDZ7977189.1 reverse transcriptase N-terminal domain-containing protein [Nostoc sp. DedQUE03]
MKSWSARALAVRRVTQDNQGKKTAGVDGVKSLSPKKRLRLIGELKLGSKVSPTRRVWIPKPGTQEKRPLGIPTIFDRALQCLVKQALEPEWEARFEPNPLPSLLEKAIAARLTRLHFSGLRDLERLGRGGRLGRGIATLSTLFPCSYWMQKLSNVIFGCP